MSAILLTVPEAKAGGVPPPRAVGAGPPRVCRHCGIPSPAADFCCAGCAYVYRLIHEHGLEDYYHIKDAVTAPADASLFHPRDLTWLEAAQKEAEAADPDRRRTPALALDVQGISCAGCVWLIERLFQQQPGAGDIEVNAQTGQMRLRWIRGAFDAAAFARVVQNFNYLVGPAGATVVDESESRALVRRIGLCAAFTMNVMLFTLPVYFGMRSTFEYASLFGLLSMGFATLSVLVGGSYFLSRAVRAMQAQVIHLDLPIALGIIGAYGGSLYGWLAGRPDYVYFDFVSTFILLMLTGRWAQLAAVERNQRRLLRRQPAPPTVRVLVAGEADRFLPPDQLRPGMRFAVGRGQMVPVAARLANAEVAVSLSWINGEADPRVFHAGERVPSGAENLSRGEIMLTAVEGWEASLLAALLRPVERVRPRRGLLEHVIQAYLIGILGCAGIAGIGWWALTGDGPRAGAVVTAILVVSCPCALGLAFPLADEMATVALRRRGVFVRTVDLWPRLNQVRRLAFDKTGTLTLETPVLQNPAALAALAPADREALAALVRDNPHPVSRCLHESLLADGPVVPRTGEIAEVVGCGVELDGWSLGRAGWRDAAPADHATVLARGGRVLARFHLTDTARPGARAELAALAARGLETVILSGDRSDKVATLARELGVADAAAIGGLSPQAKAGWFDRAEREDTLMLGDGANDSLAFDRALCRGTPVIHRGMLAAKADFYYLGRGIDGIRALFEVNDARRHTQAWLLAFMIAYNVEAVGLAVDGLMHPLLAAILMPVSSLMTLALVGWGMRGVWRTPASG
jgi:Cu2+-exporting ATPase